MDFLVIGGFFAAALSIYIGVPDVRNDITTYLQLESFILVLGGTISSTMLSTSHKDLKNLFRVFLQVLFRKKKMTPVEAVDELVRVAKLAQSGSKQSLAGQGQGKGDGFLDRALGMVAAGLEKDFIDMTLETDILEIRRRHLSQVNMVRVMGSYAPMFGMAGTVMGVIQVLKDVTNIENIVGGMALALLTTLYGLFMASLFFIPLSNKFKNLSDSEMLTKEIIREGIGMIMDKEIPLKVEKYLSAYLQSSEKNEAKK